MATRAKTTDGTVFKAGNSKAVRLPASFSLAVGDRVELTEDADGVHVRRKADKIDLTGIWGSCPGLRPLTPEEREFDERELDWDGKLLKR